MRILIIKVDNNNDFFSYENYILQILRNLAGIKFFDVISLSHNSSVSKLPLPENCFIEVNFKKKYFTNFWWYNVKLPALVKRVQADLVIYLHHKCSKRIKVPQLIVLPYINFRHLLKKEKSVQERHWLTKILDYINKSSGAVIQSDYAKQCLINYYNIANEKLNVVYASHEYLKSNVTQNRESIKEKYSNGEEFFFAVSSLLNDTINILKAFSSFKKWQQSTMKLIIFLKENDNDKLNEKISAYRYRDDVIFIDKQKNYQEIIFAAYAVIFYIKPGSMENILFDAMYNKVPVITFDVPQYHEICDMAASYLKHNNYETIAEHMLRLYKDETIRSQLSNACVTQLKKHNYQNSFTTLQQIVDKLIV